ncbi:zinc finger CCCH domain-containing protein 38-like [Aristolochia californica]|uniref:zinc finger CCCH domain-containing protein 38-like n=1 Tax=Aristolochia californica TaxID=171875 RepID=UPI0035D8A0D9
MSDNVRRKRSKWDLVAEPNHPTDGGLDKEHSEKLGWTSLRSPRAHDSEHPYMELNDSLKSEEGIGRSSWEHMCENKDKGRSGNAHRKKVSPTAGMWGTDEDYSNRRLPSHDARRERSRSRSPRGNYGRRLCRSRSPGPDLGFKRGPERWTDKSREGPSGSTVPCKDFIAGRCRRQSQCRYLHDYFDGRKQNDMPPPESRGGSKQEELGDHSGYEVHTDSRDPQRDNSRSLIPCHDFEKGKCHRGSTCKYLHHGANVRFNPTRQWAHDRKEADVSSGHDRRHEHEPRRISDIPCKYFSEGCCRNGDNCRFSHQGSVLGGSAGSPQDDLWSHNLGMKDRSREGSKWGNNAVDENMPGSLLQGCDKKGVDAGSGLEGNQTFDEQRNPVMSDKKISVSLMWGRRDNDSNRDATEEATKDMNSHCMDREESVRDLQDFVQHQNPNKDMKLLMLPNEAPQIAEVNNESHLSENNSVHSPVLQSFNPPVLSPQIVLSSLVRQSLDLKSYSNTKSQPLSYQNVISEKVFEAPAASNLVTNEQVAQLTHLSASLAQIFANGHNLPQLYASLNPPNTHPELNSGIHLKHYDPLSDSVEAAKLNANDQSSELSSKNISEHPPSQESNTPMMTLDPLSGSDGPIDGDPHKSCVVEEKPHSLHENPELQQLPQSRETGTVSEADAAATEQGQNETELAIHVEDKDTEAGTDAEGKRSKDAKGVRMFKFSLVEFVKEMLKPTWKEGHMSKEAHKTIVKKVVDKVTGSLPGPNVPQTQEKIDSYLSHSKPKLSKLVQAYVEKYMKS